MSLTDVQELWRNSLLISATSSAKFPTVTYRLTTVNYSAHRLIDEMFSL